jgi:hypothetical protein
LIVCEAPTASFNVPAQIIPQAIKMASFTIDTRHAANPFADKEVVEVE